MESPPTSDNVVDAFDPSRPFHGLVLCCTSIEADQRSEIAQRTTDMGGVHKYDLTLDVTHLIVGDYNTPKYRHVAKERPDIKPMAAGWVDAVRRLWLEDKDMDFAALEELWKLQTFESAGEISNSSNPTEHERQRLVCCLTGFEDDNMRAMIEDKVSANGGVYVADLSRKVTHLIVAKPEGKKYNAARKWGIRCISIEWLHDSVERGMILNEDCYDPTLPAEEIGKDAWSRRDARQVMLGKRTREGSSFSSQAGRRKLRKSASTRMNNQSHDIWGDILNQSGGDLSRSDNTQPPDFSAPTAPVLTDSVTPETETSHPVAQSVEKSTAQPPSNSTWPDRDKGVFASCRFFIHGFPEAKKQVLLNFLTSHGGQLSSSLEDSASSSHGELLNQRYLLVPQVSQPNSHPELPDGVQIITEFFIERCIHNKTLYSPKDHVLGRPFPRFPIEAFQSLTICTAGFVNEQLNQIEKSITQLGATYSEKLNRQVAMLVCPNLRSLREQKRDLAVYHNIPVINVEWLWQCITAGCFLPWESFQFEELTRNADALRASLKRREESKKKGRESLNRTRSEPLLTKAPVERPSCRAPAPPPRACVDMTAFNSDIPDANRETTIVQVSDTHKSPPKTTPAGFSNFDDAFESGPLSETTINDLNKSTSPSRPQQLQSQTRTQHFPTEKEVGDSEAGEESDATTGRSREPPGSDVEAERKGKAQQTKDLERRELSKRLNSLMSNDDISQEDDNPGPLPRPARRKRQILGRAASNVSAASSMSADSAAVWDTKTRQPGPTLMASASSKSEFEKFLQPGEDSIAEPDNLPPSTQLEYDNPEARKHRQVVLDRIMGHKQAVSESEIQNPKNIRLPGLDPSATKRTSRQRLT
ncbi:hypothetical protein GGS21DRAFT_466260 [Xylaria nigripes]|nr:hypothetical protein GGS21DRAFT_466260 [Xylaria nigripes]